MRGGLHDPVRLGGFRKRPAPVDDRPHRAGFHERPDVLAHRGDDRGLLGVGPGAQRGGDDRALLAQQQAEVELALPGGGSFLRARAESLGNGDFSPLWAGQNASGCREIGAGELTRALAGLR